MVEPTPIAPAPTEFRRGADHDFQGLLAICSRCGKYEEGLPEDQRNCLAPLPRLQMMVQLLNGTTRYFPLIRGSERQGWKIDPTYRTLVIGKGLGRIILPLDNIEHFSPQDY